MRKILLALILLVLSLQLIGQINVFWRADGPASGDWQQGANPCAEHGTSTHYPWWYENWVPNNARGRPDCHDGALGHRIHFDNTHQPVMTLNASWYNAHQILFLNATPRTINGIAGTSGIDLRRADARIENQSTGTHTFNAEIAYHTPVVNINPLNGNLVFNSTILNNGHRTDVSGGPTGSLTISGGLTGTGGLTVVNNTTVIIANNALFSGGTSVAAGTLELRGSLPNSAVTVNNGAVLRINGNGVTVASLTIQSGGSVVIESGQTLTVTGTLTNNAGITGLVIRDGGSLIHNTANVSATMQRLFSGSAHWRLVSSPVANQTISGPWTPASPSHGYDFYAWYENGAIWRNQKETTNQITHFEPGKGYLVSFEATNLTQSFDGPLNYGNVGEPVRRTHNGIYAGANLLGNPYASSIDWHLADRTLFADHFAYVYDRVTTPRGTTEGYLPVNGAVAGALIAPNQGFFVIKSAQGTANFTFTNAMRAHGGVFKSAPAAQRISLTLSHGGWFDQAEITLQPEATPLRETSDALKFFSYNENMPQIYTTSSDGMRLAINSVGQITQESSFNIGIRANATGQYIMQIEGLEGEFMGLPAFIRDLTTGELHNLRENPRVSFHATKGEPVDRFILTFTQPTNVDNLPVDATLVYFAHGMLHMQFPTEESNRMLHVIDLTGRVVLSKSLHGMGNVVSVPLQLVNGAYIVRITGETSITSRRIWVK